MNISKVLQSKCNMGSDSTYFPKYEMRQCAGVEYGRHIPEIPPATPRGPFL